MIARAPRGSRNIVIFLAPQADHFRYSRLYKPFGLETRPTGKRSHSVSSVELCQRQLVVAMIDNEGSTEDIQQLVAAELLRCLGIGRRGTYPIPLDSVFSSRPTDIDPEAPVGPTEFDLAHLQFVYGKCQAGESLDVATTRYIAQTAAMESAQESKRCTKQTDESR